LSVCKTKLLFAVFAFDLEILSFARFPEILRVIVFALQLSEFVVTYKNALMIFIKFSIV